MGLFLRISGVSVRYKQLGKISCHAYMKTKSCGRGLSYSLAFSVVTSQAQSPKEEGRELFQFEQEKC